MPLYEYVCPACEKPHTVAKPMKLVSREESCPDCGEPLERVWEASRPIVKGGTPTHHQRAWLRGPGGSS